MGATVRPATPDDAELLARLTLIVQDLHVTNRPDQFRPTTAPEIAAWYRTMLANPKYRVWIAEVDAVGAGYASAGFHDRPATPFTPARRWCEFDQMAVDPAFRKQGVAQALMQTLVAAAHADGFRAIETVSWSFNKQAHETLQRFGFSPKLIRFELVLGEEPPLSG